MDFTSISEYFYKFFSTVLLILLLPIVSFIYVFLQPMIAPENLQARNEIFLYALITIAFLWMFSFIFFNKKIKSVRKGQGLREKLEKYFRLTIVRYIIFALGALLMSVSFYLTRNDVFSLLFILQMVISGILWPTSSKVSNDLKLRGDEREMVYYKKDVL